MHSNGTQVEMIERQEPRFVRFTAGDVVEGVLVGLSRQSVGGKAAIRYTVEDADGEMVAFIGTHQINQRLRPTDVGHKVEIRCVGEDTMVRRGDNCMKVFEVLVSKHPVMAKASGPVSDLGITDEDIPF